MFDPDQIREIAEEAEGTLDSIPDSLLHPLHKRYLKAINPESIQELLNYLDDLRDGLRMVAKRCGRAADEVDAERAVEDAAMIAADALNDSPDALVLRCHVCGQRWEIEAAHPDELTLTECVNCKGRFSFGLVEDSNLSAPEVSRIGIWSY